MPTSAIFNEITLIGNVVRDPDMRALQSGQVVTKFTLAVNRITKGAQETDFIDIVAWDKLAERCNNGLKKGSGCLVSGRLQIRPYDDKDGNKRRATEVVINKMQFLDHAPSSNGNAVHEDVGEFEDEFEGAEAPL